MNSKNEKNLIDVLSRSKIYQDYERAFNDVTGLPLALRSVEIWNTALRGKRNENPFCALMAKTSKTCSACLETQEKISKTEEKQPQSTYCFAGLCDTTIPVLCGEHLIGFLQTGQIALKKTSKARFNRIAQKILDWGVQVDLKQLEEAYFHTKVLSPTQYKATIKLLETFASHLSAIGNQIVVQQDNQEPIMIQQAKRFINDHKSEDVSLTDVAKAVNVSVFYFCKMFKKVTGINFTDYLSRVRIEKSKNLLLNPNLRVSEIAYEVGFQSLTHFNRVFLKIVGQSPSEYRRSLPKLQG
jgi:AraC-like DNA-binding protein